METNISFEEMKKIEINILERVDKVCRANGLKYSLTGGSLIGAIRHKGFIPWDDDIDIMLPRPDYEKLEKIMLKKPIEGLKYMSYNTQGDYYYPYAKVVSTETTLKEYKLPEIKDYGVFIDIFPIDGTYKNPIRRYILAKKLGILGHLLRMSFYEEQISRKKIKKYIKNIISIFAKKVGFENWINKIDKVMRKIDYTESEYVSGLYGDMTIKKRKAYTKDMFEDLCEANFENIKVLIIKRYDECLTDLYGEYMKFPPSEKQVSNHSFERIEWKEKR